jgi:hypothetical protein
LKILAILRQWLQLHSDMARLLSLVVLAVGVTTLLFGNASSIVTATSAVSSPVFSPVFSPGVFVFPAHGTTGVAVSVKPFITFTADPPQTPIYTSTLSTGRSIGLFGPAGFVPATTSYNSTLRKFIITPSSDLAFSSSYSLIVDKALFSGTTDFQASFSTESAPPAAPAPAAPTATPTPTPTPVPAPTATPTPPPAAVIDLGGGVTLIVPTPARVERTVDISALLAPLPPGVTPTPFAVTNPAGDVTLTLDITALQGLVVAGTPVSIALQELAPAPSAPDVVIHTEVRRVDPVTGAVTTVFVNTAPPPDFATGEVVKSVAKPVDIRIEGLATPTPVPGVTPTPGVGLVLAKPVEVTIGYNKAALPKETTDKDLALFFYNEATGQWVEVAESAVDAAAGKVTAKVTHLTIFSVMAKVPFQKDISTDVRYYGATQRYVAFGFRNYFDQQGGIERFGLPITDEFERKGITSQYFQRTRLEFHPELGGVVTQGNVGKELLEVFGGLPERSAPPRGDLPAGIRYFPETGHYVSFAFKQYFESKGGEAVLGLPVSEEVVYQGITAQWFEKARLEWHPEIGSGVVLLGLVGDELAKTEGLRIFRVATVTTQ